MKHHRDSRSNYGPPPGRQSVQPSWISRGDVRVEGTASLPTINGTDWQHYVDRSLLKGGTNFAHPNAVQRSILAALNQASTSVLAFAPEKSGKTTAFLLGAVQCITKWRQENAPCTVPGAPLVIVVLPSDALVQETAALLQATASTVPPTVSTGDKLETVIRNLSVVTDILLATPGKLGVLLGNMHINTARLVHLIADACEQYNSAADLAPLKHAIAKLQNANARFTISGGGSRVQTDFRDFIATTLSAMHVIVTDETASCSVQPCEPAVVRFTVPPNVAGCVVGKQGSLLQKLKAETQCEITIARPAPNGTQEVTIKGAPEAVQHARARMNKQWLQAGAMVRKKFAFREEFYGLACGSNGTELARFKEEYNVYVSLGNRDNSEYSDFAWIEFSGFPVDVGRACERFQQLMAGASDETVAWPEQVEQILVPLSVKSAILGERAVTLRGIMKEFGVFLTFKNGQSANGFVPLAIRGLGPGIVRCKQALADIIRDPAQAENFGEHKSTHTWPSTENQAARMGVVPADEYIPQAYVPTKNFIPVTHSPRLAKFGRYSGDYAPPANAVRMCESDFEGISVDAGPVEALIRLELKELMLRKTIAEGDTERSNELQLEVLNLCDALLVYFNDECGRNVPPEKNVLLLEGLNPSFGHFEVARLFQVTPHDIVYCRTNADDLLAAKRCYCVFKTAEDAARKNAAEAHGITVRTSPDFEHFYRHCVRRILVLNAKTKGEVLTSQSMCHSIFTQRRRQLKQHAQDAVESNQRLEDVVLEVTDTLPAGRSFADIAAADQPSTSSIAPNASRNSQPAKFIKLEQ